MTIKTIYKVEGDSNEYDSEQEAQVAEALQKINGVYIRDYEKLRITKAITKRYFLCPILPTITGQEMTIAITEADEVARKRKLSDLDSYCPSAM